MLDNTSAVIDVVCEEALEVKKKHGIPRRTTIETDVSSSIQLELRNTKQRSLIIMSSARIHKKDRDQKHSKCDEEGREEIDVKTEGSDSIAKVMHAKDLDRVFLFTDKGNVFTMRAFDILRKRRLRLKVRRLPDSSTSIRANQLPPF